MRDFRQVVFIKEVIPNFNKATLLYDGEMDGWDAADFHRKCDGKGRTLTIFRSSMDYLSAGYTSIPWSSENKYVRDEKAVIFSLTKSKKVFKPQRPSKALVHNAEWGPYFSAALSSRDKMNE